MEIRHDLENKTKHKTKQETSPQNWVYKHELFIEFDSL